MKKYIVYDTTNHPVGSFSSWKGAEAYKIVHGRHDWSIRESCTIRKSTDRQRRAVHFIEDWCGITFNGDINNFYEVSDFLSDYLDDAKEIANDACASYWSMINGY